MPLKTSYFNKGLFFNNIRRFWLISFAYALVLLLFVMNYLNNNLTNLDRIIDTEALQRLGADIFQSGDVMTLYLGFFSLVSGLAVFSYMHFTKNTAMIHSLPVRREALFVTNYLSGLLLLVAPLLLNGLILIAAEAAAGFPNLHYGFYWVGVNLVLVFLLYSFTVFAGMFTGHMAAQAIFFLIFNLLAVFLESMINLVLDYFLFGFSSTASHLEAWSPLYYILRLFSGFQQDQGNTAVIIGYLIAGLLFVLSGLFLYRKRPMEVATDVISFPFVKPIFKYSVAFCSSVLLGSVFSAVLNIRRNIAAFILIYLLGGFIGYFASEMLLRKTFRVFKAYKGFLSFGLVLSLLLVSVNLDFYGYENRIPSDNEVDLIYFSQYPDNLGTLALRPEDYQTEKHRYMFNSPELINNPPDKLSESLIEELRNMSGIADDREAITKARQIHAYIVLNKARFKQIEATYSYGDPREKTYSFYFAYRLKNGTLIERRYTLYRMEEDNELDTLLRDYLALPQVREKYEPLLKSSAKDFRSIQISYMDGISQSQIISDREGFLKAYKQDIQDQDPLASFFRSYDNQIYGFQIILDRANNSGSPAYNAGQQESLSVFLSYKNTLKFLLDHQLIKQEQIQTWQDQKY